jgi:hypothetical protein
MYLARFSYHILPVNRHEALELIHREVEAARSKGLKARLLVPLTRGHGGPALQFEVELNQLEDLERIRHEGAGAKDQVGAWMHKLSGILVSPPEVEILRAEGG